VAADMIVLMTRLCHTCHAEVVANLAVDPPAPWILDTISPLSVAWPPLNEVQLTKIL
jgi:hypothetical protein